MKMKGQNINVNKKGKGKKTERKKKPKKPWENHTKKKNQKPAKGPNQSDLECS
jgi:hypothetical protein